jgi:hypothetical protein
MLVDDPFYTAVFLESVRIIHLILYPILLSVGQESDKNT